MSQLIKRAFLDTDDGQILYCLGGKGDPLMLLHMAPRSSDEFLEVMPLLAQERQVIAMDLMGLGDSDKPQNPKTPKPQNPVYMILIELALFSRTFVMAF